MRNMLKRIFNFICFFIIAPVALFSNIFILKEILSLESLFWSAVAWLYMVLAYKYLIKLFDDKSFY